MSSAIGVVEEVAAAVTLGVDDAGASSSFL
jgi:hypothetical protein